MRSCWVAIVLLHTLSSHAQPSGNLWQDVRWQDVPQFSQTRIDSAVEIRFVSVPFQGEEKEVFAYYCSPSVLSGTPTDPDHAYPAVMLVHGGGGKAFKEWTVLWAARGYAALALDLRGNDGDGQQLDKGYKEPGGMTPVYDVSLPKQDQWLYHAVADVLIGHSLLRSLPEVDSSRTALTGISWGGVISCIAAGVDKRYKAVVPVYGCGYLEGSGFIGEGVRSLDERSKQRWLDQYDPSGYLPSATMPMFFVNGTNDRAFYLSAYAKSLKLVKNGNQSIKVGLEHSHPHGWANQEIYTFVDQVLENRPTLPQVRLTQTASAGYRVTVEPATQPLTGFMLNYTTDEGTAEENRRWHAMELRLDASGQLVVNPPPGCTAWFVSAVDGRGNLYASYPIISS